MRVTAQIALGDRDHESGLTLEADQPAERLFLPKHEILRVVQLLIERHNKLSEMPVRQNPA